jgi:prolyl oligopeptidase
MARRLVVFRDKFPYILICTVILISLVALNCGLKYRKIHYPLSEKIPVIDTLHETIIVDNYRWLENDDDPRVETWTAAQEKITRSAIDRLSQRKWLIKRFNALWRYDDEGTPHKVLDSDRLFFRAIKKDWERWAYYYREGETDSAVLLLDPNQWGLKTLNFTVPSRNGEFVAFGTAEAGNEQTYITIMEVSTNRILPDSLKGWRQAGVSWLPDNSGFYYSACPLKGEVPGGEENYWRAVYLHKLGTPLSQDKKIFYHDEVKEYFHGADVTEDGKYVLFYRSMFNKNEIYLKRLGTDEPLMPIITGFDARYSVDVIEDKLIIRTDLDAPKGKVYVTDIDKSAKAHWQELIPETDDNLLYVDGISGCLYAVYTHNAHTVIKIYSIDGKYIRDVPLPTIGSAWIWGFWSKPEIWVSFSSFTYPRTIFKYKFNEDELELFHRPPIDIDVSNYVAEQIWYESKDETDVSMFLIHHKDITKDGDNPIYLTGYGGFNVPIHPYFSSTYVVWLEAGGMIAIPNLRGGGEYGKEWHEAGMRDKKQNTFDDFIAAAEWLIEHKYTNSDKLAIGGGSNGGLLVGAVVVQRPDLFKVVYCGVPLLDMLRYHKFGYANIWAEEYGSAEDVDQFAYLVKYSPYHNVIDGTEYPTILFVGSENDARCYPLHARKMVARMQEANPNGEPILLIIEKKSGHGGGTTISERIGQRADIWTFLMDKLGMKTP